MRKKTLTVFIVFFLAVILAACSTPLTTREKGGLVGGGLALPSRQR